jgi:hypothetical protein
MSVYHVGVSIYTICVPVTGFLTPYVMVFFIKDFDLFSLLLSSWNFNAASFAVFRLTSNNLCHWQIALSRVCKSIAMKVLERDDFLAIVRSNSYLVALLLVTQHTWKL